ncbi:nucleotide exchange factor GrpE [Pseudooceanicola sp. HF7]|uniref:nucleotide exchange factor GrpE n=1 Tax=Pseudooceanicola sp. HF7 TaxID=2721560 RepID=UPI0014313637|nr:nucleotide exchange factor GrpE [Pseudooceanicola sp. HF7]NIZ09636.1 nucleotide exchange factor GrpE [Pseudooceanicola sp. HF7]
MAEPKDEDFLDDLEAAEAEAYAAEEEEIDGEAAELDAVIAERDAFKDKFMRALADAENARKRADKQRREAENYGGSKLARDMLPVYDNMKRAIEAMGEKTEENAALHEGIELTMRELVNVFRKHGIEPIAPEVGDRFDPNLHEAMFEAPLPGTKAGEIIQVSAEGFMLHDRLLRPAQVGVSSNPG